MSIAKEIEACFDTLWPLNRSLTGKHNRTTLKILSEISNLDIIEVPSGTKCFDWTIPPEYDVTEAYIETESGTKIIDFKDNNLHLMSYSTPIDSVMSWDELNEHLFYIEDMPDAIPYKTSYYQRKWGFCLSWNQYKELDKNINYKVVIKSSFKEEGAMTIGERVLEGKSKKEILISTYICHPSMANNELSGPLFSIFLQRELEKLEEREYTYRFVYLPETIGSIYYLTQHGEFFKENLIAGYVITCIGDGGAPTLKLSRRGDTIADKATQKVLKDLDITYKKMDYFPSGSDERQYCSPYFNLPVVSLMRTMYAVYPEYHTSLDNKDIMDFEGMESLIEVYKKVFNVLETNVIHQTLYGKGEPFLQNKGLYSSIGGPKQIPLDTMTVLWIMNQADGNNDLIDISEKSNIPYFDLVKIAKVLESKKMIKRI